MPQEALFRKGSLFIFTGPNEHLHMVMNDPVEYPVLGEQAVLLVNFCTFEAGSGHDNTCLLNVGDHPFLRHQTYTDYRRSALLKARPLSLDVGRGLHRVAEPFSDPVYQRVLEGFGRSNMVEPKITRFLKFLAELEQSGPSDIRATALAS